MSYVEIEFDKLWVDIFIKINAVLEENTFTKKMPVLNLDEKWTKQYNKIFCTEPSFSEDNNINKRTFGYKDKGSSYRHDRRGRLMTLTNYWRLRPSILLIIPYVIWAGFRTDNWGDTFAYREMFEEAPASLTVH